MRKFTESVNGIDKTEKMSLVYWDLFPLLRGLESERPGIKDRIWSWMCDEWDVAFKPYNGRISNINLFYCGIGDEYPTKYAVKYSDEIEHSKSIHPEAFKTGTKEETLRLDLNLIWSTYEDDMSEDCIESFSVIVRW